METLIIQLSKRKNIYQIIGILLLLVISLLAIIMFFIYPESYSGGNIFVLLIMFLGVILYATTLIGQFFFLRLKDPKIAFTTEGILFDEYIQGMIKWEEIAHINFGKKVRMRKPSKKYSSIVIIVKDKVSIKFIGVNKQYKYKQYHIDVDTNLFKKNVNDEIERIMEFITTHCSRYKRYKVPHQTRFVLSE